MKQICVKIDENLLEELDKVVMGKPYWVKRNTAICPGDSIYFFQDKSTVDAICGIFLQKNLHIVQ